MKKYFWVLSIIQLLLSCKQNPVQLQLIGGYRINLYKNSGITPLLWKIRQIDKQFNDGTQEQNLIIKDDE